MLRYIVLNFICFLFILHPLSSQIVTLNPSNAGADDAAVLTFDASQGNKELQGATKVYAHIGIVTDKVNGTAWQHVIGNWGQDDGIGQMTKVAGSTDKWQLALSPTIRQFFGATTNENIFRISCVFRSADGSKKGTITPGEYGWGTVTSNNDIYVNLNVSSYVQIESPIADHGFYTAGQSITIKGKASSFATALTLSIDEGNGFQQVANTINNTSIAYTYVVSESKQLTIKFDATINGTSLTASKDHQVILKTTTVNEPRPAGMSQGVNYNSSDPTKATLVLLAPLKSFIYVVGDFNNWKYDPAYQMKKDGEYFWLTLENLDPTKPYVYQYWIDDQLKVADPYTHQVADPWNDKDIEPSVFPNLPAYDKTNFGIASVLQKQQTAHNWSANETTWERPNVDQIVIYELHIRDFLASHSYTDLIDTLSYFKKLGINAIELMPINEFEGNDSWGYNPSFFFATDKYYGTPQELQRFIDEAHQQGIAVIMDIVLNHSYGQSPLVQMYFDQAAGKPAANNPWYNREYVGQYQWGYDFNHESTYTKALVDDINRYWLTNFHFDGFRFDFTKGFTNYAPGGSVDGFDQSRINILKRMSDQIRLIDPKAYIILEHWAPANEEAILAGYGMKMWRNKSYDFVPASAGNTIGSFSGTDATSHVTFYDSHDEQRIAYTALNEGLNNGSYAIKNETIMTERMKLAAAFLFLSPGPKMMWQFDELAYDIDINYNGRLGRKPMPWGNGGLGYDTNELRQFVYTFYSKVLALRQTFGNGLSAATKNHSLSGQVRRLSYNTTETDLVVLGNFGTTASSIDPKFSQTGWWYNYFTGDSINVTNLSQPIALVEGDLKIFTSKKLSDGFGEVLKAYENPVTFIPENFATTDEVTIRFDAKKASPKNTAGLIGAQKVYMHSGLIAGISSATWTNTVGSLTDDNVGAMTNMGNDIWEIKIKPKTYYNIADTDDVYGLAMYFRNADNTALGYGYRDTEIRKSVQSDEPFITVSPSAFAANTNITITFNAKQGNGELVGATKVYMHSGVATSETSTPQNSAWANVVGNWGQDDGVGLMTKVSGETDKWQITLTPKQYYNLADGAHPYWIAAVFRNADGSKKGTGSPGPMEFGFIHTNLDFFIRNYGSVNTNEPTNHEAMLLAPNPATDHIYCTNCTQEYTYHIYNSVGAMVLKGKVRSEKNIDISRLNTGAYSMELIDMEGKKSSRRFIKVE